MFGRSSRRITCRFVLALGKALEFGDGGEGCFDCDWDGDEDDICDGPAEVENIL
jgi:hypothetical protein